MISNTIDIIGQIADLKDTDYKNTLSITVLLELLIEKGICTREDFSRKARELEQATLTEIVAARHSEQLYLVKAKENLTQRV